MPNVYVNDAGTNKAAKEVFINDAGTWKPAKEIWVNDAGTWKKTFPESSGSASYTSAGTVSWVVPNGVYSLNVTSLYGAGGGSGAGNSSGDGWVGGGGGAGGKTSGTIAVTPGETLTLVIGNRGYGASFRFNSGYSYNPNNSTLGIGTAGTATQVKRGATVLLQATGGGGGVGQTSGDAGGTAGTPTVAGTAPTSPGGGTDGQGGHGANVGLYGYGYNGPIPGGRNGSGTPPSGSNPGTGYGNGGGQAGLGVGIDGQDGAIFFSW